jgi:hypothetical protein
MKILILLIVVVAMVVAGLVVRSVLVRASRHHDPVEYYRGWGSYRHPIVLQNRITKEEADALAKGSVYLIGYFDGEGKLLRVVKFLRGEVFFEYLYEYHPNGRLKSARVTRGGRETLLEYDERGRRVSDASIAF